MVLYNADGTRPEMSGNGIRCFAQAVAMRRGDHLDQLILTDAGQRLVTLAPTSDPTVVHASVDMGEVAPLAEPADWHAIGADPLRPVSHLSLGNPHSVVGVDDVDEVDLLSLGRIVPYVNLEIIEPGPEAHAITMRARARRRHHRSMRHRRLRRRLGGAAVGSGTGGYRRNRGAHGWRRCKGASAPPIAGPGHAGRPRTVRGHRHRRDRRVRVTAQETLVVRKGTA